MCLCALGKSNNFYGLENTDCFYPEIPSPLSVLISFVQTVGKELASFWVLDFIFFSHVLFNYVMTQKIVCMFCSVDWEGVVAVVEMHLFNNGCREKRG